MIVYKNVLFKTYNSYYYYFYFYKFLNKYWSNFFFDLLSFLNNIYNNFLEKLKIMVSTSSLSLKKELVLEFKPYDSYIMKVERWSFNYFVCKYSILYWYIRMICYDLWNIDFLKYLFFDFTRYILTSTAFINFMVEILYYFHFIYIFKFIENSFLYQSIMDSLNYIVTKFRNIMGSLNIIGFFYFLWKLLQYYVDIFSFNMEFSRFKFFDYAHYLAEKKWKYSVRRRKSFPRAKNFDRYHFSLIGLKVLKYLKFSTGRFFIDTYIRYDIYWFRYLYYNFIIKI